MQRRVHSSLRAKNRPLRVGALARMSDHSGEVTASTNGGWTGCHKAPALRGLEMPSRLECAASGGTCSRSSLGLEVDQSRCLAVRWRLLLALSSPEPGHSLAERAVWHPHSEVPPGPAPSPVCPLPEAPQCSRGADVLVPLCIHLTICHNP